MSDHNYHFDIAMTCSGCSGAIDRVLKKMEGVKSYEVSLEKQTADIVASPELEYGTVLEKIKKTGKTVKGAQADGVTQEI
ncbi:MAG: Cytosolic copper metallochaperone [Stictis urceolatum]|nr:Cytosolic copper metallochaperone [Stictis urceolata]